MDKVWMVWGWGDSYVWICGAYACAWRWGKAQDTRCTQVKSAVDDVDKKFLEIPMQQV